MNRGYDRPMSASTGARRPGAVSGQRKVQQQQPRHTQTQQDLRNLLRKEETNQLSSFLKTEHKRLDKDISSIQMRLSVPRQTAASSSSSGRKSNGSGRQHEATSVDDLDLEQRTASMTGSEFHITGSHIDRPHSSHNYSSSHNHHNHSHSPKKHCAVTERDELRELTKEFNSPVDHDDLLNFLVRLKLKMEDVNMAGEELREFLLPSDLGYMEGEYFAALKEVVEVLQTDLLMPITPQDQIILVKQYGTGDGDINVRQLLRDLGKWSEHPNTNNNKNNNNNREYDEEIARRSQSSTPPASPHKYTYSASSPSSSTDKMNMSALRDLVFAKDQEREEEEELRELQRKQEEILRRRGGNLSTLPALPEAENEDNSPVRKDTKRQSVPSNQGESFPPDDRMKQLEKENQMLKKEVAAFDGTFFEQLEDLKDRYTRLQQIAGEAKPGSVAAAAAAAAAAAGVDDRDSERSHSPLPLDRLAWSVRNSMTAMDKASGQSPLVMGARRAYLATPNANTYAPGSKLTTGDAYSSSASGSSHIGGEPRLGNQTFANVRSSPYPDESYKAAWDKIGGTHGIGAGMHSTVPNEVGGSFSNLCERRLAFELSNHPAPEQATRTLIHRVMDVCRKKGQEGYITVPQLQVVIASVGLRVSDKEVEVIASGFASNGEGAVDAKEVCRMVSALLYNLIGEHAARAAETQALTNGSEKMRQRELLLKLMIEFCDDIITHDKKAVLGDGLHLYKRLLPPFEAEDKTRRGKLDVQTFFDVCKDLGCMLTLHDLFVIAQHFAVADDHDIQKGVVPSSSSQHNDIRASFNRTKLTGALSGASAVNPSFGDWLSNTSGGRLDLLQTSALQVANDRVAFVDYPGFVNDLSNIMEEMLEKNGGVSLRNRIPWTLKEFEFVDALISQLEGMKPGQRRRVLMALQYSLSAADPRQEATLDGFTVLKCLLDSGFRLQRTNRVHLLRAVEEMGGKMDYRDLCQVLLNSCADWTTEESHVVKKILKAMGVTVLERRSWLGRLRQLLTEVSTRGSNKHKLGWGSNTDGTLTNASANTGIAPPAFLHCLRDCGAMLTVDEEAVLLDCLDTERLAQMGQLQYMQDRGARHSLVGKENWAIPLIFYESFLNFCARHCGEWYSAVPEVNESLKSAIRASPNAITSVHEFAGLLHSFDDESGTGRRGDGTISRRAFQICCHRSRLLSSVSDNIITSLADVLVLDGGGRVRYTPFLVHCRALASSLTTDSDAPSILYQLLKSATDATGMLTPLRNWLVRNTDGESFILTPRDLNALLREFSVIYRPDDLEQLQMDIGRHVGAQVNANVETRSDISVGGRSTNDFTSTSITNSNTINNNSNGFAGGFANQHVVDSRDLMVALFKLRPSWSQSHPAVCNRMLRSMKSAGLEMINATASEARGESSISDTYQASLRHELGGLRGIETAVARRILTRLRAFAFGDRYPKAGWDAISEQRGFFDPKMMIEKDIFAHLVRATGCAISDSDVLMLADATDSDPLASHVRCDVILEALAAGPSTGEVQGRSRHLTDAGQSALNHLRDLLWRNAVRLNRTRMEWVADVRAVFAGFDRGKTGFISTEDFTTALSLLNSTVSSDILLDICFVPEGPGLVAYNDILAHVLEPPEKLSTSHYRHDASDIDIDDTSPHGKTSKSGTTTTTTHRHTSAMETPVRKLVTVIRRSLHQFIVSDTSLEEAWMCLLKVFKRFDPKETNLVNPRDFSLAVSVLMDGDDVVLTKSEWADVIEHFALKKQTKETQQRNYHHHQDPWSNSYSELLDSHNRSSGLSATATDVDYMLFCETVLDPVDVFAKIKQLSSKGGQSESDRLERSKSHLSRGPGPSYKERIEEREKRREEDAARRRRGGGGGGGGGVGGDFGGSITGESFAFGRHSKDATNIRRPSSANRANGRAGSRSPSRELLVDRRIADDDVATRYKHHQEEKDLNRYGTRWSGRTPTGASGLSAPSSSSSSSGSSSSSSSSSSRSSSSSSNNNSSSSNYRVASTQGQSSRDGHAANNNNSRDNHNSLKKNDLAVTWSDNRDRYSTESRRANNGYNSNNYNNYNNSTYSSGGSDGAKSHGATFATSHAHRKVQQRFR